MKQEIRTNAKKKKKKLLREAKLKKHQEKRETLT